MDRHREDKDRDWDRDHDHDRFGDDFDSQRHRRPSRFSDAPPNNNFTRSPANFRSGFSPGGPGPAGGHRSFDTPPGGGAAAAGFRPLGPEFDANFRPPLSGQKRAFPFSAPPPAAISLEDHERRNFVKLFIGSVPKTATEEDIRPLFEEHGTVIEVTLIKDKRTGQQQGCCFVKYATSEDANRAIQFLHNQCTLPGGIGPIQVRYADGERERLGNAAVEYKLFVGSLNKHATEKEVEEMFVPYGRVEDVYLMRDERRQSRGCGFVKFSLRDSAMAAINALNGIYTMRGCDQPLIVRFADPKRPRAGESRGGGPANGSPGFAPLPVVGGARAQGPSGGWSPQNMGSFHGSVGSVPGYAIPCSTSMSPQLTTTAVAGAGSYSRTQTNETASEGQATQLHYSHTGGQIHQGQQLPGFSGQLPALGLPPNPNPNQANLQGTNNAAAAPAGAQIPTSISEHQSPSQLAQMLAQQRQSLQASLQSSQHAFSQLQQQLQMRQPQPAQWAQSNNSQPTRPVAVPPPKCNWTEHVSPDGYKYYYNSVTGESRWTRPEEMAMPDQQQQQQPQTHFQQPSYQAPGSMASRSALQGQEWMWKNSKAGGGES